MIRYNIRNILLNSSGASAIEFAIMLPIFVMFVLACIEFGMYFVKDEITSNAVSSIVQAIQRDPTLTNQQLQQLAQTYGDGLIQFESGGNYICGKAYTSLAQAQKASPCTDTNFFVTNPGPPNNPYYIVVNAAVAKKNITPLANFASAVKNIQVAESSGAVQVGQLIPPACNLPGQYLQWNGTQFTCQNGPPVCDQPNQGLQWNGKSYVCSPLNPDCNLPWQKLQYSNGNPSCVNVPYIMAGGVAKPGSNNSGAGPGSYWTTDNSNTPWLLGTHNYYTLCAQGINFTIPPNLPSGQIIAAGELFYPGVIGAWHSWVISFRNFNAPLMGGNGSTDICEANSGNWNTDSPIMVGAEHVAWMVTFFPSPPGR